MSEPVRKYLTTDEVERVLVCTTDPTDKLLIQMGLSLGCRVSEIVNIKLINIDGRVIQIYDEKKDEPRQCVIDSDTQAVLDVYLKEHYVHRRGVRKDMALLFDFSEKTANRKIKAAFARAKVSKDVPWRWHSVRHTYVRRVLDQMQDRGIQFICEQTGDTPQTILTYYGVPSIDDRLKVADEFKIISSNVLHDSSIKKNMNGGSEQ